MSRKNTTTLICAQCGKPFAVSPSRVGKRKFCSVACWRSPGRDFGPKRTHHGDTRDGTVAPEYVTWHKMKQRCLNPNDTNFSHYGGRGVRLSDAWRDSYEQFLADVGRKPSPAHSIDRIDVNGDYEPGNVRWATLKEQANNKRTSRLITFNGVTQTVAMWASEVGLRHSTIAERLQRGWSVDRALTTPSRKR